MKLLLLNAILTIKFGLAHLGKCCSTYELLSQVLKEIGTVKAYDSHSSVAQCTFGESCEAVEADFDDDTCLHYKYDNLISNVCCKNFQITVFKLMHDLFY